MTASNLEMVPSRLPAISKCINTKNTKSHCLDVVAIVRRGGSTIRYEASCPQPHALKLLQAVVRNSQLICPPNKPLSLETFVPTAWKPKNQTEAPFWEPQENLWRNTSEGTPQFLDIVWAKRGDWTGPLGWIRPRNLQRSLQLKREAFLRGQI